VVQDELDARACSNAPRVGGNSSVRRSKTVATALSARTRPGSVGFLL
jgi:hypothetical protein